MQLRTLLTLVNFGTIGAAVVVLILYPQWAPYAFYLLLGWMFGSLALIYSPWAARPVGGAAPAGGASPSAAGMGPGAGTPLAAGPAHEHSSSIGFCLYCAAPVEPGTARCPACGHLLPHFS
jgi:hypothetical protein